MPLAAPFHKHRPYQPTRPLLSLTVRETEVLALLLEGATAGETAALLGITPTTAHAYRKRIRIKAGCLTVGEVVRWWWNKGKKNG